MAKSKKNSKKKEAYDDDGNIQDERFQIAQTHPQFQKLHTNKHSHQDKGSKSGAGTGSGLLISDQKIEVDERFSAIYNDSRFAMGGDVGFGSGSADGAGAGHGVDKYGRKKKKTKKKKKDKHEKLDKDGDDGDDDPATSGTDDGDSDNDSDSESESDEAPQDAESRIAFLTALSRGEVELSSSDDSSDDDDSADEQDEGDQEDNSSDDDSTGSEDPHLGRVGVLDPASKQDGIGDNVEVDFFDKSKFLALCNMDWLSTRSVDLLSITSSFAPPGSVKCVKVYPSDFGMERMANDLTLGPRGIWKKQNKEDLDHNDGDNDDSDGETSINERDKDSSGDDDPDEEKDSEKDDQGEDSESDEEAEINDEDIMTETYKNFDSGANEELFDNDFDAEKLRAYEASKMKYYFAVIEFTSSEAADAVYKELDGMEIGNSSANIDLRAIPETDIDDVVEGRAVRDQASSIPSNYNPPDFVVAALQSTAVKCTWEEGDKNRERMLTQYGVGDEAWAAMTEGDDLRAYLASDASSGEDSDEGSQNGGKKEKAKNMRALLGLGESGDEDDFLQDDANASDKDDDDDDSFFGSGNLDEDEDDDDEEGGKQATFVPGQSSLEEKIRSKLKEKEAGVQEASPWEKYQDRRKEKLKEKKRLKKLQKAEFRGEGDEDDPFSLHASAKKSKSKKSQDKKKKASSKEELDLLLAGDNDEEAAKDFHMRDIVRIEKNKSKKLRGSRKKKEADIRENASGLDFQLDTKDNRFAAVLEGTDDRFGIDRMDPRYKETPAMREILTEQTKRRKSKKRSRPPSNDTDINADTMIAGGSKSTGALALSSLVKNLKSKVAKTI